MAEGSRPSATPSRLEKVVDMIVQGERAAHDMKAANDEMVRQNVKGADKYFHCTGSCRAAKRGEYGKDMARFLGAVKEANDRLNGQSIDESVLDLEADARGLTVGDEGCDERCSMYKVRGLKEWK